MLKAALIEVLLFSALNMAPVMTQCSTCHGTGKVVCPYCQGSGKIAAGEQLETCLTCLGSGVFKPTIANLGMKAWTSGGAVFVSGMFQNEEDVGVYGTAIAEVEAPTQTYTDASSRTYFPPHESIDITITIKGIEINDYRYLSSQRYLRGSIIVPEVDDITCLDCDGTGFVSALADCPECDGTEFVTCPECGGARAHVTTPFTVDWAMVGVGVVAVVAIAAVVVVRRKKVTEKDLRRLPPNEFQNWVVQRLSGTASSPRDSRIGIDAYTAKGHPIQIKQTDNIGRNVIDNFAAAMGRVKAKNGIVVAFGFSEGVYRGIVRAKLNYGIEIKTVTVRELIESRQIISL